MLLGNNLCVFQLYRKIDLQIDNPHRCQYSEKVHQRRLQMHRDRKTHSYDHCSQSNQNELPPDKATKVYLNHHLKKTFYILDEGIYHYP